MAEKITSIAELKKAIEDKKNTCDKMNEENFADYNLGVIRGLKNALDLISEFEANVRERTKTWERAEPFEGMTRVLKGQVLHELRRILGGEG